jgi:hypothetical protein
MIFKEILILVPFGYEVIWKDPIIVSACMSKANTYPTLISTYIITSFDRNI